MMSDAQAVLCIGSKNILPRAKVRNGICVVLIQMCTSMTHEHTKHCAYLTCFHQRETVWGGGTADSEGEGKTDGVQR